MMHAEMKRIRIRMVPVDTHKKIKVLAAEQGRTMNTLLLEMLANVVSE